MCAPRGMKETAVDEEQGQEEKLEEEASGEAEEKQEKQEDWQIGREGEGEGGASLPYTPQITIVREDEKLGSKASAESRLQECRRSFRVPVSLGFSGHSAPRLAPTGKAFQAGFAEGKKSRKGARRAPSLSLRLIEVFFGPRVFS